MSRVVIVVPCFNEADRLRPRAFEEAVRHHPDVSFVFVDDGSRDGTAAILEELSLAEPDRLHTISNPLNRGKAEAVREGFLEGFRSEAEIIGYWDADLATPLVNNLDDLLTAIAQPGTRVVLGSRVRLLGRIVERRPVRHYLGRVFATAASILLGLHVYDTQCGAKLFRRTPDLEACFSEPFRSRWFFDVEILARLIDLNPKENCGPQPQGWVEVPLRKWHDVQGSKIRFAAYLRAPFELARIALGWRGRRSAGRARSAGG